MRDAVDNRRELLLLPIFEGEANVVCAETFAPVPLLRYKQMQKCFPMLQVGTACLRRYDSACAVSYRRGIALVTFVSRQLRNQICQVIEHIRRKHIGQSREGDADR